MASKMKPITKKNWLSNASTVLLGASTIIALLLMGNGGRVLSASPACVWWQDPLNDPFGDDIYRCASSPEIPLDCPGGHCFDGWEVVHVQHNVLVDAGVPQIVSRRKDVIFNESYENYACQDKQNPTQVERHRMHRYNSGISTGIEGGISTTARAAIIADVTMTAKANLQAHEKQADEWKERHIIDLTSHKILSCTRSVYELATEALIADVESTIGTLITCRDTSTGEQSTVRCDWAASFPVTIAHGWHQRTWRFCPCPLEYDCPCPGASQPIQQDGGHGGGPMQANPDAETVPQQTPLDLMYPQEDHPCRKLCSPSDMQTGPGVSP